MSIDGRYGEGGGSILRVATGLSAVTGRPVEITNVRVNRPKPGLAPQHLAGLKCLARLFNARTTGLELGSTEIGFFPHAPAIAELEADAGTAGSVALMLQSLMIPIPFIRRRVDLSLTGGTHVPWSPSFDYLKHVTLPLLNSMGCGFDASLIVPGYYPRGGGRVVFSSRPCDHLEAVRLDSFGEIASIEGISRASNLPEHVASRQANSAAGVLGGLGSLDIRCQVDASPSPGSAITLWASTTTGCRLGAVALGKRGKPAETVGREAAGELREYVRSGSPVDPYMLDQILPYCALARGTSILRGFKLTAHATTNAYVIGLLLGCRVEIDGQVGERCTMRVEGVGLQGGE